MNQIIVKAIKEKRLLSFIYEEQPRVVEPHWYGLTIAGHEALCCYQVRGKGIHLDGDPWDVMLTSKMSSLALLPDTFSTPRPGYKRRDKRMVIIYCEL